MFEDINKKPEDASGLFVVAGLFLGCALGLWANNLLVGLFLGLGVGFLMFAIVRVWKQK